MIKFFISLIFFALGYFVKNPESMVTIDFFGYRIFGSVFNIAGLFFATLWLWDLLLWPVRMVKKLCQKRHVIIEQKKHDLLLSVLLALNNQEVENYSALLQRAEKLYKKDNYIYWMIRCLLLPDEESYRQMTQFPQTTMGGIRGLFHVADTDGDLQQMRTLLDNMPENKKKTPWALQAYFQLCIQENDWTDALDYLKQMKRLLKKDDYNQRRACCLFLNGDVKEAYHLDPTNPAIVIGYAKINPKKAGKIFKNLWAKTPTWPIYESYKEQLAPLNVKDQQRAIKDLVSSNAHARLSLLALADIYLNTQDPVQAKKYLDEYLQNYSLTKQVALMQARVERDAWNHEDQAREWEEKAPETEEDETTWHCETCDYKSPTWRGVCPVCHTFNGMK